MANKDTELVVTNQIGSSGNENVGDNKEIRKLRRQIIEMHRAWANGLPPPPVPTDNLEYLSSLPPVSHAQFPIFIDMPQHASGSTLGQQYPTTSKVHFLTPQSKTTIYSAPAAVHAFTAPPPLEAPTFDVHPQVVPPYSTREPALNIFSDQYYALEPTFKSTDLCMFPGLHLPLDFEMPKFEKYDGHGDPVAHLRHYCNQLRGAKRKEELLMAYFRESLSGLASKCNIVEVFIQAQDETYYQHLLLTLGKPFIEVLKMGEMIRDGIKTGRIMSFATLKETTQAIQKEYNGQPYVQPPSYPHWCAPTLPSYPPTLHTYRSPSRPGFQFKPNNKMRQKSRDSFIPIGASYTSLFQRLVQQSMITPLLSIEDFRALKREIEKMIQDKSIMVQNIDSEESSSHADMQTSG
ncbi:hypothetical protein P3S67_026876 [Capsicum chacoense]